MKKTAVYFGIVFFFFIRSLVLGQTASPSVTPSLTPSTATSPTPTLSPTPCTGPLCPTKTPTPTKTPAPTSPPQSNPQPTVTSAPASSSSSESSPTATEVPTPATTEATIEQSPTPTQTPTPTPEVLGEQTKELDRFDITVRTVDKKGKSISGVKIVLEKTGEKKKTNKEGETVFPNIKRGKHTFLGYYADQTQVKIVKAQGTEKAIETTFEFERKNSLLGKILSLFVITGVFFFLHKKGYLKKLSENPKLAKLFASAENLLNKIPMKKIESIIMRLLKK